MQCNIYKREDYGGYWRRSFGDFFDGIFLSITYAILSALPGDPTIVSILGIMIFLAYMIGFKVYKGATPGYQLLGMKLVSIDGSGVTVKQIIVRLLSSIFSALAFGLGFIWIAVDSNKQAWHDKAAGTYVIKTGAIPVQTVNIPQSGLIRGKLAAAMILLPFICIIGLFGGVMHLVKGSDAYRVSEQYIKTNPWVQREIGTEMKFGSFPHANVSVSGSSGKAEFEIQVSGERGKITVYTFLERRQGEWVMIEGGFKDKEGNFVNITSP